MKLRSILLFLFPLFCITASAQTDSSHLRISLLTCGPGTELYSTFGHTAIRVTDSARGVDMVYNYGTFDDRDPNFYVKFTRGIMIYALSNYSFQEFLQEYAYERRYVIEQELNLNGDEKQRLYAALQENALEQNRYYNYYFHTDNCTTRARDMITQKTGASVVFKNILPEKVPSFRNLIHTYLNKANQHWSKFGIDLLLGSNLDHKVTNESSMFLPDYLLMGFDSAMVDGRKLVTAKNNVLPVAPVPPSVTLFTPLFVFGMVFIIITLLSFSTQKYAQGFLNVFDAVFFLLIGLFGVVIVTLWAIRVDDVCRNNYNLGWALPTHFFMAFVVYLKRKWIQQYFRVVFVLTLLFAVCWFFIPQKINMAVLPLLGIVLVRSNFRGDLFKKRLKTKNTTNEFFGSNTKNAELK
ncbi:Lnb N-terminal periplasmic domain-containing protein [Niastella populi]|uniref:Uncharacterized protein n=1 Tax=Niastella populi TaxID=550983 RepID=A0A1V9FGV3_9BACT|nr:DUF4105 domain-containing protein [Niastella populi]OQP57501.1 hypothetical protein A4R26_24320 [Niastella populi]